MQNQNTLYPVTPGTVYIVGAGPGAPDLIAVRGRDIIAQSDLILYADSLVEYSVADLAQKERAEIVASSGLHLGEMMELMVNAAKEGKVVARVHSGDPALYGATHEQMAHLEDHDIPYEIVPGITAAFAAAAILKSELTVPDVVQTIILTRTAGRTTMPAGEDMRTLAAPGASLAVYLSVTRIQRVVDDLLASGAYTPDTPVAVLHKVTWPDESYVVGTLADIGKKVREAKYTKHALILVSPALDPALKGEDRRTSSHLYDPSYTHRFRKAENFQRGKEQQEAAGAVQGVVAGEKHLGSVAKREGTVVISVTKTGTQLAHKLAGKLDAHCIIPTKFNSDVEDSDNPLSTIHYPLSTFSDSALAEVRRQWGANVARLILVMPTGVAVRAVAPLLTHKSSDPAVVCMDEAGHFAVPLVGGHQAGANELALELAALTKGEAVITTASDVQGKPALDLLGKEHDWRIANGSALTHVSAALVNDETIGLFVDVIDDAQAGVNAVLQPLLALDAQVVQVETLDEVDIDSFGGGIIVTDKVLSDHHKHLLRTSILYHPPTFVIGMGCKKGVPETELATALTTALSDAGLAQESAAALTTVDLKAEEPGMVQLAQSMERPLTIISSKELQALPAGDFSPSAAQEKLDLPGVAEPCATLVGKGELILPKRSFDRCTVAVVGKR